jgi:phosphohistidine swiveling domain-containing protein
MNKKYEFHARGSDIPFVIIDIFYRKGSYGSADLISFLENNVLSLYWSEEGMKQAAKIGEQMLDEDFFADLIKQMDKIEKDIDQFSFTFENIFDEWKVFEKLIFDYSTVYRFCEEPFSKSIEKKILACYDSNVLNDVMRNPDKINDLGFNEEEKNIVNVLITTGEKKLSLHLKNDKFITALACFMAYLSKKTGIPQEDLYLLKSNEIIELLEGKNVDFNLTNKRKEGCVFSNGPDEDYLCVTGEEFLRLKELIEPKTKEVKGFVANRGKVKGKVRVHLSWVKAIDFDKGDIIVTGMTNPQMFPYLKKAAAIVTDEGGITCHAAIISRELGIPCIIGTKVATQVLKDGDLVEVDAEKGTVRKVEDD